MRNDYFARVPAALGIVKWPDARGPAGTERATVIVKITFVVAPPGVLRIAPPEALEPLALDTFDADGTLVYPSDFAVHKPACDVVIVGRDVAMRRSDGSLGVNGADKRAGPRESLGPRETFCMHGDPTDPSAVRVWSAGKVDFARFQSAPPDQRIAHPRGAFSVRYYREGVALEARFDGPEPVLRLFDAASRRPIGSVALTLDTIALRPSDQRASLVWRGVATYPSDTTIAVIDLQGAPAAEPWSWPHAAVLEPSVLREEMAREAAQREAARIAAEELEASSHDGLSRTTAQVSSDRTAFVQAPPRSENPLPFSSRPPSSVRSGSTQFLSALPPESDDTGTNDFRSGETRLISSFKAKAATPFERGAHDDDEPDAPAKEGTAPRIERVRAMTLPFKRGSNPPASASEPLTPNDFAKLRESGPVPRAERSLMRGTVSLAQMPDDVPAQVAPMPVAAPVLREPPLGAPISASSSAPPRSMFELRAPPTFEAPRSSPPTMGLGSTLQQAPPASRPPAFGDAPIASPAVSPSSPPKELAAADRLSAIQREVWKGERSLADILKDHGMTELEWRAEKRKAKR